MAEKAKPRKITINHGDGSGHAIGGNSADRRTVEAAGARN